MKTYEITTETKKSIIRTYHVKAGSKEVANAILKGQSFTHDIITTSNNKESTEWTDERIINTKELP